MARFQIHESAKVSDLTDAQASALTSYLSTPSAVVDPMSKHANNPMTLGAAGAGPEGRMRLAKPGFVWRGDAGLSPKLAPENNGISQSELLKRLKERDDDMDNKLKSVIAKMRPGAPMAKRLSEQLKKPTDGLSTILVENEARNLMRENIAHHRNVGNYKGRRHAMGFPVRGQRTRTNASTARKLNRIERRR